MSTSSSLIGTTLGAYEIQALLGSGGMATVYRGFDVNLHRSVAIKVLSAALAADPDYVNRFRQEARLIANLRHPHIAQVFAFGEHAGAPYMVQELLPGPTLEQRLKDLAARHEPMPRQDVIATITQLADALDAAHAVGVIHRDVKPSNALYNAEGQIVLADFGIARNAADASRTATAAGVVMGTPGYIAPEQAISSAALTPACDIYALGVVLFELLCGRLPFEADTAMGVVLKHLYDPPPPPTSVRPELPPAIDTVVLRALEKEPTARFSSAGALAQALAAAWPVSSVPAPAAPDIHSQATSIWTSAPRPAMAQPSPAPRSPAQSGSIAAQSIAGSAAHDASRAGMPARGRPRLFMPLLGLLLVGLLIAGAALAARGAGTAASAPSATPARSTAPAVSAATPGAVTAEPSAAPISPSPTAPAAPTVQTNTTAPTPASSARAVEPSPPDCGTTITAPANADAWIEQNSSFNNKGSDSILKVKSQGPSDNFRALVQFAQPASVPQGCVVQSATLRMFAASSVSGRTLQVLQLAANWSENSVTWSDQPATTGAAATASARSGYQEWDVTAQVRAMYDMGANHGFLIRDAAEGNSGAEQQFHSREKGESMPQLVITFAPAALAPATAAPTALTGTTEPIGDLRALLTTGISAGQVGKDGRDLLKKLDELEQAIAKGDQKKASEQLRDLQKKIREIAREDKIDTALAEQTLAGIDRIASTYGLSISSD